jgi:hypothetical protein
MPKNNTVKHAKTSFFLRVYYKLQSYNALLRIEGWLGSNFPINQNDSVDTDTDNLAG